MLTRKPLETEFIAALKRENRSEDTSYNYLQTLRSAERFFVETYNLSLFIPEELVQFTIPMINSWTDSLRNSTLSDQTRKVYYSRLRRYLKWAPLYVKQIDRDLPLAIPNFTIEHSNDDMSRVYTDYSIVKMLEIAQSHKNHIIGTRNAAIIALLAGSAMRGVEVVSLTVGDYLNSKRTHVLTDVRRKGGGRKSIAYASFVAPYVDRYLALRTPLRPDDPLFASASAPYRVLDRRSLRRSVSEIQKAAGVKTGTHNFRHTVVTRVAEANNTGVAAAVAGHTNIKTTADHYIHINGEARRAVVDNLSINQLLEDSFTES